ncbi:MAG: FG-GAP repeat protein [Nitrospira sp.]|nr:FG-GAP repeat protein [Nitrospira sp.]
MFTTTRFTDYPPGKLGRVLRIPILALLSLGPTMIQGCGSDETPQTVPQTVAPLKQQAYVKASNTESDDWFGTNIAVDGDTLVVGARFEDSAATGINGNQADNSAPDSGAVYVFTRTGGVWSQQAHVKASNTEAGDRFGIVAIDGDTLAVGAIEERSAATGIDGNQADNNASDSGAVYIFQLL